jgi:soluble lytic murein transglycosylase
MKRKTLIYLMLIMIFGSSCSGPVILNRGQTETPPVFNPGVTETAVPLRVTLDIPTPTPTVVPAVRIQQGDWLMFIGSYVEARQEYESVLQSSSENAVRAAALLGIGHAEYRLGEYSDAVNTFNAIIEHYTDSEQLAAAYFFLGECFWDLEDYNQAAEAYQFYYSLSPGLLGAFVQERQGDALRTAGRPGEAIDSYEKAIEDSSDSNVLDLKIKIGRAYVDLEDHDAALSQFLMVYDATTNDYTKAQVNLLAGYSYLALDLPEQAYARFLDSVENYPLSYDAYTGLVILVNDDVPVSVLSRGIVDYYARQYGIALDVLTRYLNENPEHEGTAHHYKALSYIEMEEYEKAIAEWEVLIDEHPGDSQWVSAWDSIAFTQWAYQGEYTKAAETYLEFVSTYPTAPQCPDFLYAAGWVYERDNQLVNAAATWQRVLDEYASSELSFRALFLSGISHYRMTDYVSAQTSFQQFLLLASTNEEQSGAYFWVGKAQAASGDQESAQQSWTIAAELDPTGYYSERANQILQGQPPLDGSAKAVDFSFDLEAERNQAEGWLRSMFAIPNEVDVNDLSLLIEDDRFQRGEAYWELGLYNQALAEFESLRKSVQDDPVNSFRLLDKLLELGFYRSAILLSRQILDLSYMDDAATLRAPVYFNHIRFGPYYQDLILPAAYQRDIDPFLLFSLVRQESFFDGVAQSAVGARGLMQIMPATGQEIVTNMGWPPDYTEEDLYRPVINVTLGANYLARQRDFFDGDMYSALAAYNGGPGNTLQWSSIAQGDPDLFVELIRFTETRNYIMNIFENVQIYQQLYQ